MPEKFLPSLGIATLLCATAVGCGASAADTTDQSEGAATATNAGLAVGDYDLDTYERSGSLTIESLTASELTFDLEAVNKTNENLGVLTKVRATAASGGYRYTTESCNLTIQSQDGALQIVQHGSCDFGEGVNASGKYVKRVSAATAPSLCDTAHAEEVLFTCNTKAGKTISICGYKGAAQYRYGVSGKLDIALPKQMQPSFAKPEIAEGGTIALGGPGGPGGAWATFHNGQYDYTVFTMDESKGVDAEGRDLGVSNESGVLVFKGNQRIAYTSCVGFPASHLPSDIIATSTKEFDTSKVPSSP